MRDLQFQFLYLECTQNGGEVKWCQESLKSSRRPLQKLLHIGAQDSWIYVAPSKAIEKPPAHLDHKILSICYQITCIPLPCLADLITWDE